MRLLNRKKLSCVPPNKDCIKRKNLLVLINCLYSLYSVHIARFGWIGKLSYKEKVPDIRFRMQRRSFASAAPPMPIMKYPPLPHLSSLNLSSFILPV